MEVGKRVRVIAHFFFFYGKEGIITTMPAQSVTGSILVQLDADGKVWPFDAEELEVIGE